MATNVTGNVARLFGWQMLHYYQRGGPNDPDGQSLYNTTTAHWGGGSLSWNSVFTYPPVPGTQTPPAQAIQRTMTLNTNAALSLTTGALAITGAQVQGGILLGTIPGGSWVDDVQIFCYEALTGGTSVSFGLFYAPAGTVGSPFVAAFPQPNTMYTLGYVTSPATGTIYGAKTRPTNAITGTGALVGNLAGYQVGPGYPIGAASLNLAGAGTPGAQGFAGMPQAQASGANPPTPPSGDIDIYACTFLIGGAGTAPTQGSFGVLVTFTGQEG